MLPRDAITMVRTLLLLLMCAERCAAVKWLALYKIKQSTVPRPWDSYRNCSKDHGLVSRQLKMCRSSLDFMSTVVHAASLAVDTCQSKFKDRRWNCASVRHAPSLTRDLTTGTREQAYVYGISAAALVHSISRACSIGISTKCRCGDLPSRSSKTDFKWDGCPDNLNFGLDFGTNFTDATLKSRRLRNRNTRKRDLKKKGKERGKGGKTRRVMMNKHNFAVGRKVVSDSIDLQCKCHGVSGSCSMKSCWKALGSFDAVGEELKKRYFKAVHVRRKRLKDRQTKVLVPVRQVKGAKRGVRGAPSLQDDLVFLETSPDYCDKDHQVGSFGTKGRICEPHGRGGASCNSMCCGRGYDSFTQELQERCECKYIWCCSVKCKICKRQVTLSKCR